MSDEVKHTGREPFLGGSRRPSSLLPDYLQSTQDVNAQTLRLEQQLFEAGVDLIAEIEQKRQARNYQQITLPLNLEELQANLTQVSSQPGISPEVTNYSLGLLRAYTVALRDQPHTFLVKAHDYNTEPHHHLEVMLSKVRLNPLFDNSSDPAIKFSILRDSSNQLGTRVEGGLYHCNQQGLYDDVPWPQRYFEGFLRPEQVIIACLYLSAICRTLDTTPHAPQEFLLEWNGPRRIYLGEVRHPTLTYGRIRAAELHPDRLMGLESQDTPQQSDRADIQLRYGDGHPSNLDSYWFELPTLRGNLLIQVIHTVETGEIGSSLPSLPEVQYHLTRTNLSPEMHNFYSQRYELLMTLMRQRTIDFLQQWRRTQT